MVFWLVTLCQGSLLTKKSETWIQIQRYVEMMPFLPFGNPWGYRFQAAFGNSIQGTKEVDKWAGFLYLWKQILSDFLHQCFDLDAKALYSCICMYMYVCIHQADIKSLNSAKSLNNPIPVHVHLVVKGTRCLGLVELVFEKCLNPFVTKCIWLDR